MKMRAPSSASALAQALPSPLLAPAMKALQSFKPRFIGAAFPRKRAPGQKFSRTRDRAGRLPNRRAPAAAANQLHQHWLPERSIRARAHKSDRQAPVPSRSTAPREALLLQPRAPAARLQGPDPPIQATVRPRAHPALIVAVVEPNPVPPPGFAADHQRAKLRVRGALRQVRERARALPQRERRARRAAGRSLLTASCRAPQGA